MTRTRPRASALPVLTRRKAVAVTAASALLGGAWTGGRQLDRIAAIARPRPGGSSTTRCAQCGESGHTMLVGRCPAEPRVL